jgi:hypothetical protein
MKVCVVSNDLLLVYSSKIPFNNNITRSQYNPTNNEPRRQLRQNCMQNSFKKRHFQQTPGSHHTKNGNCSENCKAPKQNGEEKGIKHELPKHVEPLNGEMVNGHSEHESNDTYDKGGTKTKTADCKAEVEYPGNQDNLKNSDVSDKISQKSHPSNGELPEFHIYKEITVYISCI